MTNIEPAQRTLSRPGWPEIVVGLLGMAIIGYGIGSQLSKFGLDPVTYGLIFTALSGIGGLAGFGAAVMLRIRSLEPFGIRRTTRRWLLIGIGAGVLAFIAKSLAILAWIQVTGDSQNVQQMYGEGGSGGVVSLVLAILFLAVLTPIGEEFLFRGVVAQALLRYGPWVGVIGSALIFALMHGINTVFPAALVAGLFTAEIFRRSGSIWPAVVVHVVFNLPTIPFLVLAASNAQ
jgi:membrane protease YdiL (CAAX protease family)